MSTESLGISVSVVLYRADMVEVGGAAILNNASLRLSPLDLLSLRRFPTVERRCKLLSPSLYHALPSDLQLCEAVITKCSETTKEVHIHRHSMHFACVFLSFL